MSRHLKNQRGQGLIEYLIIVALMGVATMAIVRVMSENVSARFTEIAYVLKGDKKKVQTGAIQESHYRKKDLGDFLNGAASQSNKND